MELEKTLLRKVGEAIHRFKMIRDGDRVAVALSGGKDSLTLLESMLLLAKRAPVDFTVCAFTVEQGKFLEPVEPLGEWLKSRNIEWTYFHDKPSFRLLKEQPQHGCDLCSRYRRRAVYEIARGLGANVFAQCDVHRPHQFPAAHHLVARQGIPADPPAGICHRRSHRCVRGFAGRSDYFLRVFAANGHGPQVHSQYVRQCREGISTSEGDAALRDGEY